LKKKLDQNKSAWVEFVPKVLWSYCTTIRTPTKETPFSLTFGTEAVIPAKVGYPSFKVSHYNPRLNDEGISLHLDLLEEKRRSPVGNMGDLSATNNSLLQQEGEPQKFQNWRLGSEESEHGNQRPSRGKART
jgi:hypothetical protein